MWTPWGPGEVPRIDRCFHFRGKFIMEYGATPYEGWEAYLGDSKCPLYRGVYSRGVL